MIESFDGIVLFKRPHRNRDSLVKIFTKEFGKRMFFVRHGQKENHPLQAQLIACTHNRYIGTIQSEGLCFVQEAQTLDFYRQLQSDYVAQAHATYLLQLIDAAIEDGESAPDLYELLVWALEQLNDHRVPEVITAYVEIHLLPTFGITLDWASCQICHEVHEPFDFSVKYNGLLCHRHWQKDERRLHIPPRSMHIAYLLANMTKEQLGTITVSTETLRGLRRLMDEIYREYVGIRLRSRHYLSQLAEFESSMQSLWKQANQPQNKKDQD